MEDKNLKKKDSIDNEDMPKNTWKTIIRLFKFLKPQSARLAFVTLLVLITSGLYAVLPLLSGTAINNLVDLINGENEGLKNIAGVIEVVKIPVILIIIVSLITSLMAYVQQYIMASVGENLILKLRRNIMLKINKLPLSYFDRNETGDIMSKVTNDLEKVSTVM